MLLLDIDDVEKMFQKKVHCFGLATTAVFATTAGTVAANMALVGTLVSTVGAISQGQTAAGNARFQGQVQAQNAELARRNEVRSAQQAKIDEDDFRRQASRQLAQRFASGGATGVLLNDGSFGSIQAQIEAENELNALRLRNQFQVRTTGFATERQNQIGQAGFSASNAKSAATEGLFNAGSQVFKGANTISKIPLKK